MSPSKDKRTLIVVHSIKGGCGKTTIALALAQYLAVSDKCNPEEVCYVDTDLVGVGTQSLIANESKGRKKTFSDFVLLNPFDDRHYFKVDFEDCRPELFKEDFVYEADIDANRHFHAIFSSTDNNVSRQAIHATSDLFYAEDIKSKIKTLLSKLFSTTIRTIILDTTPGLQGITKIILDISEEFAKNEENFLENSIPVDIKVLHIILSTNNFSHLKGLQTYLSDNPALFLKKSIKPKNKSEPGEDQPLIEYFIILNQIPIGAEFISNMNYSILNQTFQPGELKEMKDIYDTRITEFIKNVKVQIGDFEELTDPQKNQEALAAWKQRKGYDAFINFFTVKEKNFLPSKYEKDNKNPDYNISDLGERTFVIPELPGIRMSAAEFFKFDPSSYFNEIKKEVKTGYLQILGDKVAERMGLPLDYKGVKDGN